jgi:hypothetical protein
MPLTAWIIAILSVSLPQDYSLVGNSSEKIAHPDFPGSSTTQEFRSWEAPQGKHLTLFYWVPNAPRDGGPAVFLHEYPVVVAGQKTSIRETSQFMGRKQHVLVTYLHFDNPESSAMLYADGLTQVEFRSLLAHVSIRKPQQ